MSIPVRVQRKRTKGFKLQDASPNGLPVVYVGRPSKWGNPYKLSEWGSSAIPMYEDWLRLQIRKDPHFLDALRGKNLACWCPINKPYQRCHADVILKFLRKRICQKRNS